MYYVPVFSFDCATWTVSNQPCPQPTPPTPTPTVLQQIFAGDGPPVGFQVNQTPGYPAWYQDLVSTLIWRDNQGTGVWESPF